MNNGLFISLTQQYPRPGPLQDFHIQRYQQRLNVSPTYVGWRRRGEDPLQCTPVP